ncbi:MAG: putative zinc-binding metallopeptidase [Dysgonamonadaceae bacterium]|jgi:substrate import-associated zinc metallohydrolase lipoprotein|nr:putative zinc-binding metallopeptidase [Dysgonamonadaceae bacterium]
MKVTKIYGLMMLIAGLFVFTACDKDELDPNSVIVDSSTVKNDFDKWLDKNYVEPYNVDFKYRIDNRETSVSYSLTPVEYEKAIAFAKILLHTWIGTFDEIKGKEFTQTYIPKNIQVIGSKQGNTVGEAEGGVKITFFELNDRITLPSPTVASLVGRTDTTSTGTEQSAALKTAFHEFSHILHQTKPYTTDFPNISDSDYAGGDWNTYYSTPSAAWAKGFISQYGSSAPNEDFVEIIALYVVRGGQPYFDSIVKKAGDVGGPILTQKLDIVRTYLKNSWAIDLDEMQSVFQRRVNEVIAMDLTSLD